MVCVENRVLDYVENIGVWTLLLDWPETHPAMITIAATATAVKRVLGFAAFATPLLLALVRLASTIRRRGPRHDSATRVSGSDTPTPAPSAAR
jgi:hypothetical protein